MSKLDDIFAKFSTQDDNKTVTVTWSNKDTVTTTKEEIKQLMIGLLNTARTKGTPLTWLENEINKL